MLIILIQSCQIIKFSEEKVKSDEPAEDYTNSMIKVDKTDYINAGDDENSSADTDFTSTNLLRPQTGFIADKSLNFQNKYPFTNFDTRDYKNPFFAAANFLDAINTRNFNKLWIATDNNVVFFRNIVPEDSAQFWRYIQGKVGLYRGISEMREVDGKIHFTLKSISKYAYTVIVLSPSSQSWKVSNIIKIVRLKSVKTNGISKYDSGVLIWRGNWDVSTIVKYEFMLIQTKLERIHLLQKVLTDAKDDINSVSSNFITSEMRKKVLPKFMQNSSSVFDVKYRGNLFMLNFYKAYELTELINITKFPVTENLQIETFLAIFNTKINAIVFVNWLIIDGVPYIERIELPTGSSVQVYFTDAD